jgi:hypothetical protein
MNKSEGEFNKIVWPEEFIVEFKDGNEQQFVSSKGVVWDNGQDLEDKDENRINICCAWQKKSHSQQNYRMIEFFLDEVNVFKMTTGEVIWQPNT